MEHVSILKLKRRSPVWNKNLGTVKFENQRDAITHIIEESISKTIDIPIDYVLCAGHFLGKDEEIYSIFETQSQAVAASSSLTTKSADTSSPKKQTRKRSFTDRMLGVTVGSKTKMPDNGNTDSTQETIAWYQNPSKLKLEEHIYFSCAVDRDWSCAKYSLKSEDEVITFLKDLVDASQASGNTLVVQR